MKKVQSVLLIVAVSLAACAADQADDGLPGEEPVAPSLSGPPPPPPPPPSSWSYVDRLGITRTIRVTSVEDSGSHVYVSGSVDGYFQEVNIYPDLNTGTVDISGTLDRVTYSGGSALLATEATVNSYDVPLSSEDGVAPTVSAQRTLAFVTFLADNTEWYASGGSLARAKGLPWWASVALKFFQCHRCSSGHSSCCLTAFSDSTCGCD